MKKLLHLIFFILITTPYLCNSQHFIDSTTTYLKGGANIFVKPGDTIFLLGGNKDFLLLENIHGNKDSVVTIINHLGKVEINTSHYFGISTKNCTYFRITGSGIKNAEYGIEISKVEHGSGIGISALSNHFELDHIKIANTKLAGIYAKTDPDTTFTSVRDSFLMSDVKIHNIFILNAEDEAMYIGSTKYFGQTINYRGKDTLLLPHLLENVEIANNIIINPGWDGIQLSSAQFGAKIHDNLIIGDSYRKSFNQMSGIMVGGGTQADCYNNFIANGNGSGIVLASIGGQKIFNNIIINSGNDYYLQDPTKMQHGIYGGDISTFADSSYLIVNNLIINPKSDAIRFTSLKSKNNLIANNVLINPGNYGYYDTLHTRFSAKDAYIMISDSSISVDTLMNIMQRDFTGLNFTDTASYDFSLKGNSKLIDSGKNIDSLGIHFDFYNHSRNIGNGFDIGPFEFNSLYVSDENLINEPKTEVAIFPNPVFDKLSLVISHPATLSEILISNIDGSSVPLGYITIRRFGNRIELTVKNLPKGMYIINLNFEDHRQLSAKFLKI